jgi:hypothetical protein
MDRVRFGRALGYGARHAVKSLAQAVDAATSPNPAVSAKRTGVARDVAGRVVQTQKTVQQSKVHAGKLKRSVWSPLVKFSGVLWLQVTGTFFALIAAYLSQGLWAHRGDALLVRSNEAYKFYPHRLAFVLFFYFAVSNFVRAHKRDRK